MLSLLVLGPITGVLMRACLSSLKAGRPAIAAGYVMAIATFWGGAPTVFGAEFSLLSAALRP